MTNGLFTRRTYTEVTMTYLSKKPITKQGTQKRVPQIPPVYFTKR